MAFQTPGRFNSNDFKSMLATPSRPASEGSHLTHSIKGLAKRPVDKEKIKPVKPLQKKQHGGRGGGGGSRKGGDGGAGASGGYRDRVAERNAGSNPEYKDDAVMLEKAGLTPMVPRTVTGMATIAGGFQTPLAFPKGPQATQSFAQLFPAVKAAEGSILDPEAQGDAEGGHTDERQAQIADEVRRSKFLGGDERHTHLVKGLDRALMEKTLQKQRERDEARKFEAAAATAAAATSAAAAPKQAAAAGAAAAAARKEAEAGDRVQTRTTAGAAILEALSQRGGGGGLALSSRTFFTFDASRDDSCEVPRQSVRGGFGTADASTSLHHTLRVEDELLSALQRVAVSKGGGARHRARNKARAEADPAAGTGVTLVGRALAQRRVTTADMPPPPPPAAKTPASTASSAAPAPTAQEPSAALAADAGGLFGDVGMLGDSDSESDEPAPLARRAPAQAAPAAEEVDDWDAAADLRKDVSKEQARAKAAAATRDDSDDDQSSIEDDGIALPSEDALEKMRTRNAANDDYSECFPETWANANSRGLAAGLEEIDESDLARETELEKRHATGKDAKSRYVRGHFLRSPFYYIHCVFHCLRTTGSVSPK